jgi:UDP-N-acetylmuramoyl-tripeptide--D-alanyl-D-alanine ligase
VTAIVGAFVLTAGLVAEATGGHLVSGAADHGFDVVSTDSRTIVPGALFIALRGERFDGEAFVDAARSAGAAGLVVTRAPDDPGDVAVIVVEDTLLALQSLGRAVRRRSGSRVVAITGSTGKTTTKEVTADLLEADYRVFRNPGNLNNHIGLPLSLLELRHGPDVAVVELGMNHAGEIRTLVGIAEPDIRVWTNVGDAHIGFFGSRDAVARAKAEILEGAAPGTLVVANADDPLVSAQVAACRGRVITFGESAAAVIRATGVEDRGVEGTRARVETPQGGLDLRVAFPGRPQLLNVLAGVAVASEFGVSLSNVEQAVDGMQPLPRRGALTTIVPGARLVDDSYNASPDAMRVMLQAVGASEVAGRRLAVLGEMLELGTMSRRLHEICGADAVAAGIAELVVVGGPDADGMVDGAAAAGLPDDRIHRFADSAAAAEVVPSLVGPGDLVLVKGSRGTRTDVVADRLAEVG